MALITRFFFTLLLSFAVAGSPVSFGVSAAGYPILTAAAPQAHAGVRGFVLAYAVKKAIEFGGRAVFKTLVQAASNPKTRATVFREISDYARKNPKFAGRAAALRKEIDSELSLLAKANKSPYDPRAWGDKLAKAHGKDMKSPTLPGLNKPNVKMAGKHVQVGKDRIPFNERGFPVFDKFAKYDTRLSNYNSSSGRATHMRQATQDLKQAIERGEVRLDSFPKSAQDAIGAGKPNIPGYTWHHHENLGRMQLVPQKIHDGVRHVGGFSMNR